QVIDLHTRDPKHEIFGEPAQGLVRLPMYASRPNDNCWAKVCRAIAVCVLTVMGSAFQLEACWMSRTRCAQITKFHKGKRVICRTVSIVRLFAFLTEPTPLHWKYLSGNDSNALLSPFSHACNRGLKRDDGQVGFCVNGLYHGRFATITENQSHHPCPCFSISTTEQFRRINTSASLQVDLEQHLLQLFIDLHTSDPKHEIFGAPAQGLVRLPLYASRIREPSWASTCRSIAVRILNAMGSTFQLETCWMLRSRHIQITRTSKGNTMMCRQVSIVRLL
ncbi:hypothetical protein V1509DRAFT_556494, partial [Lipomyces kononenkoae]